MLTVLPGRLWEMMPVTAARPGGRLVQCGAARSCTGNILPRRRHVSGTCRDEGACESFRKEGVDAHVLDADNDAHLRCARGVCPLPPPPPPLPLFTNAISRVPIPRKRPSDCAAALIALLHLSPSQFATQMTL